MLSNLNYIITLSIPQLYLIFHLFIRVYLIYNFLICYRYLGEHNYDFLKNLQKSYELSTDKLIVTDERIVKNGFNVAIECTGGL